MTDLSTIQNIEPDPIAPGHLILVVGPSGAGKDTLIKLAQAACANDPDVIFAQRIVTREASAYEDNIAVQPAVFEQMLSQGEFVVHWQAHGLSYGLSRSVAAELRAGRVVIANVSRTVIATLRQLFPHVVVVLVTAPPDVLAARLAGRTRTSDTKSQERLSRVIDVEEDFTINNVGRADDHCLELLSMMQKLMQRHSA